MLEIPIFGPDDGAAAVVAGAQRLELNRAGSYALGGLTPTLPELIALLSSFRPLALPGTPPIRIMIRPRGAPPPDGGHDFVYTRAELATMHASIAGFLASGLLHGARGDGFVFGVLSPSMEIDVPACKGLVEAAGGLDQ
ncbi:copper homeostasis CutC domain-containing protein [Schizothecium vesticola]|uniref:Copper homeostasis protein cutC homolog n=1 Tax=Schizothecium vesticola TaxID=314040 RepID=A0AA40F6H5_9PEZI|nr:copper homeostasis CutC domain-containing protein [Schizothecium vesticola]